MTQNAGELAADQVNITEEVVFSPVSRGIVTFPYDPPPVQSAGEFRKAFAESFQESLASHMEPVSPKTGV
jgi:hypothetical protein